MGEQLIKAQKGGKHGGKTEITSAGLSFLTNYKRLKEIMTKVCGTEE